MERAYVSIAEYMQWFMRVSKLRISRCVPPKGKRIEPRDWYPQQDMADALESAMRMAHEIHIRGPPSWFYDVIPDFLSHYDRVLTEWKGLGFSRPCFIKKDGMEPFIEQQPPMDDAREMDVDPSAPGTSHQTPPIVSQKCPREVETSRPEQDPKRPCRVLIFNKNFHFMICVLELCVSMYPIHILLMLHLTPLHRLVVLLHLRPPLYRPVNLFLPWLRLVVLLHLRPHLSMPPPPHTDQLRLVVLLHIFPPMSLPPAQTYGSSLRTPVPVFRSMTFEPIPLQFPPSTPSSSQLTPSSPTQPIVDFGFGSASIPTQLRDIFDIDSNEDKLKDAEGRGGPDRRGDMTRPLKNRKIRWLYRNWWSKEGSSYDFETWGELEDDVLNAYCELLKVREEKLWNSNMFEAGKALRFFFAPSYFMAMAGCHCPPDLKVPPNEKTGIKKLEMEDFFRQYAGQRVGPDIQFCDITFFPTCSGRHWFLFVVNLRHHRVMIIDPIRDESFYQGSMKYPQEYYIMEKFIPHMLNYLDPARFKLKYMKVKAFEDRPKQVGGVNCGVYVCKYIDAMLNGIIMKKVEWDPIVTIRNFRYRIAHELKQGEARHISDSGIVNRQEGL